MDDQIIKAAREHQQDNEATDDVVLFAYWVAVGNKYVELLRGQTEAARSDVIESAVEALEENLHDS